MTLNQRMVENLNHAIETLGLRKVDVAAQAGIHPVQLSKILHGKSGTTLDTCEALSSAIGVPAESLMLTPSRFQKLLSEIVSAVA